MTPGWELSAHAGPVPLRAMASHPAPAARPGTPQDGDAMAAAPATLYPRDEQGVLHVVALSGGKDSTAMALALKERFPETPYIYLCTPTGDELPEMFEHWRKLGDLLGRRILPIMAGTLNGLIEKYRALPNRLQRWCTRELKIEPYESWLEARAAEGPVISYVALRADEETREGGVYSHIDGVQQSFPLRDWGWGLRQVLSFLDERGVVIPERTDCARCFWQRIGEWWNLYDEHPDIFEHAAAQEEAVTEERGKPVTFRSPGRDSWPTSLREMKARFDAGEAPKNCNVQGSLLREIGSCRVCTL